MYTKGLESLPRGAWAMIDEDAHCDIDASVSYKMAVALASSKPTSQLQADPATCLIGHNDIESRVSYGNAMLCFLPLSIEYSSQSERSLILA